MPFSTHVTGLAGRLSGRMGVWRRIGITNVALQREQIAEQLVARLLPLHEAAARAAEHARRRATATTSTATTASAATGTATAGDIRRRAVARSAEAAAAAVGAEDAGHEREEARVGARLEDDGVATGLDRARRAAPQCLVRGDLRERLRIDHADVLDAGDPGPAGATAIGHAAGQHEAGFRHAIVGEESLRVRGALRLIDLRDVAGAEYAHALGEIDAVLDHASAFGRPEIHEAGQRGIDRNVFLRAQQLGQLIVVPRLLRVRRRFIHHRLHAGITEIARVRRALLLSNAHGHGQLPVVLHEVGGDRRVGPARARPLAARQLDLDGVRGGHVHDLVDDRFGFFACVHGGEAYGEDSGVSTGGARARGVNVLAGVRG